MKDIEDMNLSELADDLTTLPSCSVRPYVLDTIDRLRVLHELTRWIPVSERMPTEADGYKSKYVTQRTVLVMEKWGDISVVTIGLAKHFTHWKRITPPEGKP